MLFVAKSDWWQRYVVAKVLYNTTCFDCSHSSCVGCDVRQKLEVIRLLYYSKSKT